MKTLKVFLFVLAFGLISMTIRQLFPSLDLISSDRRWQWINRRIEYQNRQHIDYVFIGSSRTWCAIKPSRFKNAVVWNLGHNWFGRDADYLAIKKLLSNHKVDHIMLEVFSVPLSKPHKLAKFFISPADIIDEIRYTVRVLSIKDLITYNKLLKISLSDLTEFIGESMFGTPRKIIELGWQKVTSDRYNNDSFFVDNDRTNGFYVDDNTARQESEFNNKYKDISFKGFNQVDHHAMHDRSREFLYNYKIQKLAARYNTKVSYYFLSDFAGPLPHQLLYKYYASMGNVYIPDVKNLYNIEYWRNSGHLYKEGADFYTDQIKELLNE